MTKPFSELSEQEINASISEVEPAAARAYRAYAISSGGLNFQKLPMPTWLDLPAPIRGHWRAAVSAALEAL